MAKKTQKTTRETSFNYEKDIDTVSSVGSYTLSKNEKNIRLLNVGDGIEVTGQNIIDHANNNRTLQDLGYNAHVKTDNIVSGTDYMIYGAPFQAILNNRQHFNNCGIESTLNNLAMAGMVKMKENLSDQKAVEKSFLKTVWNLGLAGDDGKIGVLDENDGGTQPDDYKDILSYFNIDSDAYYFTRRCYDTQYSDINELAYKISQGYGAIIGVCSKILWQNQQSETGEKVIDHAISIVGVVYEEGVEPSDTAEPTGFYVHDTGAWMSRYISLDEFKEVTLYGYHGMSGDALDNYMNYFPDEIYYDPDKYLEGLREFDSEHRDYIGKQPYGIAVTITTEPIKTDMFNLNATGNKKDNIIWGNNGDNIIMGMAGNDTIYGNGGDDEIKGGSGDDIIIGNTGANLLYGDSGNDTIIGGDGTDVISGGEGNDFILTGEGRNVARGGKGNDVIIGGGNNDRMFGDAGNDTIQGYGGDDVFSGGDGNDHLYGGKGNDRIETGKGNDVVYFEGQEHGIDFVSSQGGLTTFKFISETDGENIIAEGSKVSDMYFNLDMDDKDKKYGDFVISYTADEDAVVDGVQFQDFFNIKSGKSKALNVVEEDGTTYSVSVSKSKTIKTKAENNIIFSLNEKGANIKTSTGNDVVTMAEYLSDDAYATRLDKITYTGGQDWYISQEGNTYYTVTGFDKDTCLAIYDNVEPLTKYDLNDNMEVIVRDDVVSTDDRLYLDCKKDNLKLFFDVTVNNNVAVTTDCTGLFLFDNSSFTIDKYISVSKDLDESGLIYMDSFFGDNKKLAENEDFFGNGYIEGIYCKGTRYREDDLITDVSTIASNVAEWLADNNGYESAFDAFSHFDDLSADAQTALVQCYQC